MDAKDYCDILTEAVEVFLNHILYTRNIYPDQIFKKRRAFSAPVYISIFPPLNEYLRNILRVVRELMYNNELRVLELSVCSLDDSTIFERHNFQFSVVESPEIDIDADDFLLRFEERLRTALVTLSERLKPLKKLQNMKFKIFLHMTQAALMRLTNNPNHQDFPWLQESVHNKIYKQKIAVLPISSISSFEIQITSEVF